MQKEETRSELIEWLKGLQDEETLHLLKVLKDSEGPEGKDWWDELNMDQRNELDQSLHDVESGKWVSDEEVRNKYGIR